MEQQQITRFTTLWTTTQSSVLAFISATITNFSDAEDVLQRVASVAVSKFDQFDSQGNSNAFTGWAIQIAKFEILNYLRSRSTDRHKYFAESLGAIAEAFEELVPEFDDRRHALADCLKELQGRSKEVITKRYGEGLKTGRIAELLGISAGNVSVILNRTYHSLRSCIENRLSLESGK